MKILVINVDDTTTRWANFVEAANAASMPFVRHQGVDSSALALDSEQVARLRVVPGTLKGMAGCTLSHLGLWELCAQQSEPMLILEDDAHPLPETFDLEAIAQLPTTLGLVLLHFNSAPAGTGSGIVKVTPSFDISTAAYRLTPDMARQLLKFCTAKDGSIRVPNVVDKFFMRVAVAPTTCVWALNPCPFIHTGLSSGITVTDYLMPPTPRREPDAWAEALTNAKLIINAKYQEALRTGVPVGDIRLGVKTDDQEAFARLLVLLRETEHVLDGTAEADRFMTSEQFIKDIDGVIHTVQGVANLRKLLVTYGAKVRTLWDAYAQAQQAIAQASAKDALGAAVLKFTQALEYLQGD